MTPRLRGCSRRSPAPSPCTEGGLMTRALPCAAAALVLSLGSVARTDAQSADGTATSNIVFSTVPAVLVTLDGDPILREVAGTNLQRVANTKALILRDEADVYYLKILDGW